MIFRIAKTELRTLFYSPIAWFLLVVFLIQCGIVYFASLSTFAVQQEIGGFGLRYMSQLTARIFLSRDGLFGAVMQNLYLYVPLLTMSLISRETSSGTIKLLYSSPINVSEIIIGKYLAMMVYSLLLLAIVAVFVVSGFSHIQNPEKGMLMSALLGFYLLLCAYSAIGLFMSCLTTYQVVAAISTFVMIGVLSYIGSVWQDVDVVRELTYFLSISGRAMKLLSGLITSKDVIYFLLIISMFLGFSIYKLKSQMESKPASVKMLRYVSIFAVVLVLGYLSSRPGIVAYYDATSNKSRTLTPAVQKIMAELNGAPLEITMYNNLLGNYWFLGNPESYTTNLERWDAYIRFKPDIKLSTVYYYDSTLDNSYIMQGYPGKTLKQIAEQNAKSNDLRMSLFKTPEEIRKIVDLRPELNRFVMHLKWKDKSTFLRVFDDQIIWPTEPEVAAAIKRLLNVKLPKIYFLTGNLERDINKSGDREYKSITSLKTFRNSLINQGFDVDTLSLDNREIPDDISVLVVADPKLEFSSATAERISTFIDSGGNMIMAGEPGKQGVLNPLLSKLGVQIMNGTVLQQSKEYAPNLLVPSVTSMAGNFTKALKLALEDSGKVAMPGVAGLAFTGKSAFKIEPLLVSNPTLTWNRIKALDPDMITASSQESQSFGGIRVITRGPSADDVAKRAAAGTVSFSPADGDTRGPLITAVGLTRQVGDRQQRIVISGDADFMSNSELQRYVGDEATVNFTFNTALFSWLNYGEFPVDATRPEAKDKRLNVTTDNVKTLKTIYLWIVPALVIVLAAVILVRRKRK